MKNEQLAKTLDFANEMSGAVGGRRRPGVRVRTRIVHTSACVMVPHCLIKRATPSGGQSAVLQLVRARRRRFGGPRRSLSTPLPRRRCCNCQRCWLWAASACASLPSSKQDSRAAVATAVHLSFRHPLSSNNPSLLDLYFLARCPSSIRRAPLSRQSDEESSTFAIATGGRPLGSQHIDRAMPVHAPGALGAP